MFKGINAGIKKGLESPTAQKIFTGMGQNILHRKAAKVSAEVALRRGHRRAMMIGGGIVLGGVGRSSTGRTGNLNAKSTGGYA